MYTVGKVCPTHPTVDGVEGLRYATNHGCVQCARDRARKRQLEFPEWRKAVVAKSNQIHSHRKRASWAKWHADKMDRVPPWADIGKIKEVYKLARQLGMTVDHVIPLRGKYVSGLHVHNNLQLLPAAVNFSKGNKFEVTQNA